METWKCKAVFPFSFFSFFFFQCLVGLTSGSFGSVSETYSWCIMLFTGGLKTGKKKATSYLEKLNSVNFPKTNERLWTGQLVCGCSHTTPPSNVAVSCHQTCGGFRCFGSQLSGTAVWCPDWAAGGAAAAARQFCRGFENMAGHWRDEWWTWGREGAAGKQE